jgi:retron-type reverse transcriptase
VSAGSTARSTLAAVRGDRVRALQHVLYRAAKADPNRRFHALFDKVHRRDVLDRAWEDVRRNRGAAGIDRVSLADAAEEYGVPRLLGELAAELRERRYRPLPARRVFIPKPGTSGQRPLSIPAVRDRVVQAALKIVLEPVFEAGFAPCSFGFRPGLSAHDALQVLIDESWRGRRWVVETDIADCFSAIPHDRLMQAIEERVCDRAILALIRKLLRAGVMEGGSLRRSVAGTPQGGPLSPLLCNAYLHRLDRAWQMGEHGVLVRYVDGAVVMCDTREQAGAFRFTVPERDAIFAHASRQAAAAAEHIRRWAHTDPAAAADALHVAARALRSRELRCAADAHMHRRRQSPTRAGPGNCLHSQGGSVSSNQVTVPAASL